MRLKWDEDCAPPILAQGDPDLSEEELVPAGNEELERLYRTHWKKLVRFAGRYTSRHDAPDIVHRLFTRMAARKGRKGPDAPEAYLRQATINLIRDDARQAERRSTKLHVCTDAVELTDSDPVAALEARDILARMEAVVTRLPVRTREIFLAHRIDGFTYGEIAARTGLSVKTIEKHMSRAIAHVTRHIDL